MRSLACLIVSVSLVFPSIALAAKPKPKPEKTQEQSALTQPEPQKVTAEPFELKGFRIGMSETEITSNRSGISCSGISERKCYTTPDKSKELDSFAGVSPLFYFWNLFDDKLGILTVHLHSKDFRQTVDALVAKFGQPTSRKEEILQNKMGATFTNEIIEWQRGDETLVAQKYTSNIDKMIVSVRSNAYIQGAIIRQKDKAKEKAKDL